MAVGSFPLPQDDDAEDVAWGLATGEVLWRQGDHLDAIVWLRRAASAALDAGQIIRSDELSRTAASLMAALEAGYFDDSPPLEPAPVPAVPSVPFPLYRPPAQDAYDPESPEIDEADLAPYSSSRPAGHSPGSWPPPPSNTPFAPAAPASIPPITRTLPGFQAAAPQPFPPSIARAPATSKPPPASVPGPASVRPTAPPPMGYEPVSASLRPSPAPPAGPPASPLPFPPPSSFQIPSSSPPAGERARRRSSGPAPGGSSASSSPPASGGSAAGAGRAATARSTPDTTPPPFSLAGAKAFDDLAPRAQARLARAAKIDRLDTDEEMPLLGLAYVIAGACAVEATVVDTPVARLSEKDAIYARGISGGEGMSLRLVATTDGTTIAHWDDVERVEDLFDVCPEALDRLKEASDRHQALAGASMGPLGERLDEALMTMATERLELKYFQQGEPIAEQGEPVPGIFIIGVGSIELERDGAPAEKLGPGDLLFATEIMAAAAAPVTARSGPRGALVLFGNRQLAHELMVSCPPLLEIFAGM